MAYNTIQELGSDICNFLDSTKIPLSGEEDGRLESLKCEDEITDRIRKQFPTVKFSEKGHNRDFGDITPIINEEYYPINVKMVNPNKSGTFNAGGPKTFNYVLFGENNTTWDKLATKIVEKKPEKCEKPYYYLIYYKNSDKKTIFCSLCDVSDDSITTNPSNPIQLKKNITVVERTEKEKAEFIIKLFKDCAEKRAQAYLILKDL
jgi:hypothetical protein